MPSMQESDLGNSSIWVQKNADQVSHDNSVIHERVPTHAQGELQAAGRLASWQVKAVALQ